MPAVKKGVSISTLWAAWPGHKNFKWIREVARRNPDKTFVVAGGRTCAPLAMTPRPGHPQCVLPRLCFRRRKRCPDEALPSLLASGGVRGLRHPAAGGQGLGAPIALAKPAACRNFTIQPATDPTTTRSTLTLAARLIALPDKVLAKYSWDKTAAFWLKNQSTHSSKLQPDSTLERNPCECLF